MNAMHGENPNCDCEDERNVLKTYHLVVAIVECGHGYKVSKKAKAAGAKGTTVFMAHGTTGGKLMTALELCDVKKEIVLIILPSDVKGEMLETLNKLFKFENPDHGIVFSIPISAVLGASTCKYCNDISDLENNVPGGEKHMHNVLLVIVEKGNAENVVEAATDAGARGATIINARGSGIHETSKLFGMEIEPEKEIVMIVADSDMTAKISEAIKQDTALEDPGKGIMVVLPADEAIGLH